MVDQLESLEFSTISEVERALIHASKVPYNNAEHIFELAGKVPDVRLGGSCLQKLKILKDNLPTDLESKVKLVTSQVQDTTHYAMVVDIDGTNYYLDPFLWQAELMPIRKGDLPKVKTLEEIWKLRREPDEDGSMFVVSLLQETDTDGSNILVTHRFTNQVDYLPSPSILPIKTKQPSYMMQIPDSTNQILYKLWFPKASDHIDNIWTVDGRTGARVRTGDNASHKKQREEIMANVEKLLGVSEAEMNSYFSEASKLERELSALINSTGEDTPTSHITP